MSSTTRVPFQQQDALIGFGDLPIRIYRKISKRVFEFTLMVVGKGLGTPKDSSHTLILSLEGESGLGKATLIDSLFLSNLYPQRRIRSAYGTARLVRRQFFPSICRRETLLIRSNRIIDHRHRRVRCESSLDDHRHSRLRRQSR